MENNNFFPETFEMSETGNYHLSIQWCSDGLFYTILDISEKKYLGLKKIELSGSQIEKIHSLEKSLSEDPIFKWNFNSVCLMAQSYKAMLVPESLFDSKNLNAFLKFHHEIDDKDHIHFSSVKPAEAFIVFSIPSYLEEQMLKYHPKVKFSHHSHPLIDYSLRFSDTSNNFTHLNIHFGRDFFDVLITRNHKILLFNSFFYQKYSDVVYFVINILNLFSLHPDHSKIIISGWINENSEIETELKKIFKTIQFAKYSLDYQYNETIFKYPQHTFVNLLNLYNCES